MTILNRAARAAGLSALACVLAISTAGAVPLAKRFLTVPKQDIHKTDGKPKLTDDGPVFRCDGPVSQVVDIGDESLRTTTAVFGSSPGGGIGGQFDPNPLLDVFVNIPPGACLDAHFSGLVGSAQTYGRSPLAMFEVTVQAASPVFAPGTALIGHFPTPFGLASPAVALEPERDVDEIGANFFIQAGDGPRQIKPGKNRVIVWWAGGPAAPGGAIGSAWVLKLYVRGQ
jgi:hypothetical protein